MAVSIKAFPEGEARVETGLGTVLKVHDEGKRNTQIEIRADHLKDPVTGWVDTHTLPLPAVNDRVAYRIDTHRKRSVDPAIAFSKLARNDKVRDVVALQPPDALRELEAIHRADGEAPPAQTAQEPPAAPPAAPSRPEPEAPAPDLQGPPACPLCSQPLSAGPVRRVQGVYTHVACDEGRPFEEQPSPEPLPDPPGEAVPPRRGRVAEGRPWEEFNSDGSLNMGSYSVLAAVGMVELAHKLAAERSAQVLVETGQVGAVSIAQVKSLARTLLEAADRVQAATRDDGHSDRMSASHTRARGAVREALWVFPVPWGAPPEAQAAWLDKLTTHAEGLLRIAVELHNGR